MLVFNGPVSRAWDHSDPQPVTFFQKTDLLGFAKGFQRRAERGEVEEDLAAIVQEPDFQEVVLSLLQHESFLHATLESSTSSSLSFRVQAH